MHTRRIAPPLRHTTAALGVDALGATTSLRLIKMDVYAGAGRNLRRHPATVAPPLRRAEPLAVGQGARASAGAVKSRLIVSRFRDAGPSLVKALMRRPLPRCSTGGPQVSKSDKLSAKRATTDWVSSTARKGRAGRPMSAGAFATRSLHLSSMTAGGNKPTPIRCLHPPAASICISSCSNTTI